MVTNTIDFEKYKNKNIKTSKEKKPENLDNLETKTRIVYYINSLQAFGSQIIASNFFFNDCRFYKYFDEVIAKNIAKQTGIDNIKGDIVLISSEPVIDFSEIFDNPTAQ